MLHVLHSAGRDLCPATPPPLSLCNERHFTRTENFVCPMVWRACLSAGRVLSYEDKTLFFLRG